MRPVLLEMTGFASFRQPTTVDFADADYFALVGPTGAGKSTVLDALGFALYGSVARWDREGMVAPALAPTVNRGTVRLVFDVAGDRYSVAREVRRSGGKRPVVTVKNARLERLADPDALGGEDDDTEPIASDSEVTRAVEGLLGLTFRHFCTCVALPQGAFAEFLHTTPSDRQKILIKLLGMEVYERIGRRAGEVATQQRQRAETLTEQLGTHADATGEVVEALAARVTALAELSGRVDAALPGLRDATGKRDDARDRARTLAREHTVLSAVTQPGGIAELEEDRRAAATALVEATGASEKAQEADERAREALRAAPDRHALEQAREGWAELARITAAFPGLERVAGETAAARRDAEDAAEAAGLAADRARGTRDLAARAAEQAHATADRTRREHDLLASLAPPADLAELAEAADRAATLTEEAATRLRRAEEADGAARDTLTAQPDGTALSTALDNARELGRICAAELSATAGRADRRKELATARTRLAAIDGEIAAARGAVDAADRTDRALALRTHLAVGAPCPVCEQEVRTLPESSAHAHVSEAREALAAAEGRRPEAESAVRTLERAVDRDTDAHTGALARADRCRQALTGAPGVPRPAALRRTVGADAPDSELTALVTAAAKAADGLTAALARRAEAADAVDQANAELAAARSDQAAARRAGDDAADATAAARSALRAARDPLVVLDAPAVDETDVGTGWAELIAWARTAREAREGDLAEHQKAVAATEAERGAAEKAFADAGELAGRLRGAGTEASRAEQAARTRLEETAARRDGLRARLVGAPSDAAAAERLDRVAELEEAARAADAALSTARRAAAGAAKRDEEVRRRVDRARQDLAKARDPLVGLGAPALDGVDLLAGWAALTGWAAAQATEREDALAAADAAVREADDLLVRAERAVVDDVTATGVALGDSAPVDRVPVAVASALAGARTEHAEMERRVAAAGKLRDEITDAQEQAGVARMLADLMRADKFQRWLVAGALDALVAEASVSLFELSGGQFDLAYDDGGFVVVDHNDADTRRPVKTLSGGETFQASLALALALSSQLGTLATAGAARLESIFLDEGFGSLDEATLDVVGSTLESLSASGSRMVGVVTHVAALAERVPVRFRVSRDAAGSHVVKEGA